MKIRIWILTAFFALGNQSQAFPLSEGQTKTIKLEIISNSEFGGKDELHVVLERNEEATQLQWVSKIGSEINGNAYNIDEMILVSLDVYDSLEKALLDPEFLDQVAQENLSGRGALWSLSVKRGSLILSAQEVDPPMSNQIYTIAMRILSQIPKNYTLYWEPFTSNKPLHSTEEAAPPQ